MATFVGSFEGDGGARKVDVRGFGARFLAGEKCCWRVVKAGLRRTEGLGAAGAVEVVVVVVVVVVDRGRGAAAEVEGWRAWRVRVEEAGGRMLGWEEDVVEVWDGGRRMVELVSTVAEDLVRV